jgi:geranylgeranyl pyrophosphate synthase
VEESSAALGKTAGKDVAQQKATYPSLFGLEKSREFAKELEARAMTEIEPYGPGAARLREVAEMIVHRRA